MGETDWGGPLLWVAQGMVIGTRNEDNAKYVGSTAKWDAPLVAVRLRVRGYAAAAVAQVVRAKGLCRGRAGRTGELPRSSHGTARATMRPRSALCTGAL